MFLVLMIFPTLKMEFSILNQYSNIWIFFSNLFIWLFTKEFSLWIEDSSLWLEPDFFVYKWFLPLLIGLMRRGQCSSWEHAVSWKPFGSAQQVSPLGGPGSFQIQGILTGEVPAPLDKLTWVSFHRWTYQEFFSRYRVLMKQKDVLSDRKQTCKNVLEKLIVVRKIFTHLYLNRCLPTALWF